MRKVAKNIFLTGMMGSWKTTIGKKLAKLIDFKFVDIDNEIETASDMSIAEIFTEKGEDYFRKIEKRKRCSGALYS